MTDLEKVHIKLGLSGTYWDKRPQYRVEYNDTVVCQGTISGDTDQVEYLEFDCEYADDVVLKVFLTNKTNSDTVENEDKTAIVKDMLLNIDSIKIDEIDISELKWSASEFVADDPNRPTLQKCVNLGWNGSYRLKFTCPFYLWLLEKL